MGQKLGSVLSIPMQQNNNVEPLFDEVAVACFLITAVTNIFWRASGPLALEDSLACISHG
jgi:hypothetical protein